MTNNTPDYEDNLYFDCKNCKYTDEYCASGDCNKIQANDLACNKISLTEQWKKGELPDGVYYCNTGNNVEILFTWGKNYHQLTNNKDEVYIPEMDDCKIIASLPSYEEWQASYNCMLENEVLRLKNAQLKELLKEWVQFEIEENPNDFTVMSERMSELANKTKEELKQDDKIPE